MWDARKAKILDAARAKLSKAFHPHDFQDALDELPDEMVDGDVYRSASAAGMDAVPNETTAAQADNVAEIWIGHALEYAKLVPDRIAQSVSDAANDTQPAETADDVIARIEAKLEALRSSITRYAEPTWGAGMQGYGTALDASAVLIVWQLGEDEDHCEDCLGLADGSPYSKGQVPTWPKAGDTQCFDNCYCSIVADEETWNQAFGGNE